MIPKIGDGMPIPDLGTPGGLTTILRGVITIYVVTEAACNIMSYSSAWQFWHDVFVDLLQR